MKLIQFIRPIVRNIQLTGPTMSPENDDEIEVKTSVTKVENLNNLFFDLDRLFG